MRKDVVIGVALRCLWAFVYLSGQSLLLVVVTGLNAVMLPQLPWFVIPLALFVWLACVWPVKQCAAWPIFSLPQYRKVTVSLVLLSVPICMAAAVIPGGVFGLIATTLPVSPHDTNSLVYAIPLVRPVYSAFTEEIGFRGILQGSLEQYVKRWHAIAVATAVFVWAHSGTAWFVPEFVFYIALSIYCGLLASRTQSVLPAILLHLIVNVIGIIAPLVWGPIHLRETPDMVVIPLFFVALACIYLFRKVATAIPTTRGTLELTQ